STCTRSRMAGFALPVRMAEKSLLVASITLSIPSWLAFKISATSPFILLIPPYISANLFTHYYPFNISSFCQVEDNNRDVIIHAEAGGCGVHHAKAFI